MRMQTLLNKLWQKGRDERGVTLVELALAVSIMVGIFTAIVALMNSMYASYQQTMDSSDSQRAVTLVLNQVAADVRHSPSDVVMDPLNHQYTIVKQAAPLQQVSYRDTESGQVMYTKPDGTEITLSDSAYLTIVRQPDNVTYAITVTAGSGSQQVEQTLNVTRETWGP